MSASFAWARLEGRRRTAFAVVAVMAVIAATVAVRAVTRDDPGGSTRAAAGVHLPTLRALGMAAGAQAVRLTGWG